MTTRYILITTEKDSKPGREFEIDANAPLKDWHKSGLDDERLVMVAREEGKADRFV